MDVMLSMLKYHGDVKPGGGEPIDLEEFLVDRIQNAEIPSTKESVKKKVDR